MTLNGELRIRDIFSKNLKYYRMISNLKQSELAEKINLTDKYISDLERARFSPSLFTICSIAEVLNIEPYLLLKYDESHISYINNIDKKSE